MTAHRFAKHSLAKCQGAVVAIAVLFSFAALSPASAYADESNTSAQLEEQVSDTLTTTTSGLTPSSTTEVSNSETTAKENSSSNDENGSAEAGNSSNASDAASNANSNNDAGTAGSNAAAGSSAKADKNDADDDAANDLHNLVPSLIADIMPTSAENEANAVAVEEQLGSLVIKATGKDENGGTKPLEGVEFVVRNADGEYLKTYDESSKTWKTAKAESNRASNGAKRFVTDAKGQATVDDLKAGEYIVEEVKTPEGYDKNEQTSKKVTLDASSTTISGELDPVYAMHDYSTESILSEFQVFTFGDLTTGGTHVVGAFATGGRLIGNGMQGGQGSVTKSYIEDLDGDHVNDWGNCSYLTDAGLSGYEGCPYRSIYYHTTSNGATPENYKYSDGKPKYEKVPDGQKIDFAKAYQTVIDQSQRMADASKQSYVVSASDHIDDQTNGLHAVNINLDEALNHAVLTGNDSNGKPIEEVRILIPYEELKNANSIRLSSSELTESQLIGLFDSKNIERNGNSIQKLVISISGAEGKTVDLNFGSAIGYGTDVYGVCVKASDTNENNGKKLGALLKNLAKDEDSDDEHYTDSQFYGRGTKLTWNLPDAASVKAVEYAGQIIAPNANVTMAGGEGNVIAKTADVTNEVHFYPYRHVPSKPRKLVKVTSGEVSFEYKRTKVTGDIAWTKADAGNGKPIFGSEWKLTRYTDNGYSTKDAKFADRTIADNADGDQDPSDGKLAVGSLEPGYYQLEETKAPDGYELSDSNAYRFEITAEGKATELKGANGANLLSNIVKNERKTGKISWTKVDADLADSDKVAKYLGGSEWKLAFTSDSGTTTAYTVVDAQNSDEIDECKASHAANVLCDTDSRIGRIAVEDLGWGTYTLTETKAPDGYLIATDKNGASKTWTAIIGREHESDQVDLTTLDWNLGGIANQKKTYSVPSTGRLGGIPAYMLAGFTILLIGARLTAQMRKEW